MDDQAVVGQGHVERIGPPPRLHRLEVPPCQGVPRPHVDCLGGVRPDQGLQSLAKHVRTGARERCKDDAPRGDDLADQQAGDQPDHGSALARTRSSSHREVPVGGRPPDHLTLVTVQASEQSRRCGRRQEVRCGWAACGCFRAHLVVSPNTHALRSLHTSGRMKRPRPAGGQSTQQVGGATMEVHYATHAPPAWSVSLRSENRGSKELHPRGGSAAVAAWGVA